MPASRRRSLPPSDAVEAYLRSGTVVQSQTVVNRGDVAVGLAAASKKFSSTYYWPNQSHASLGPSCAVADVRDGALSSSTLKEASSWGKVDTAYEQMVFSEATLALPLIAGYAWHKGAWKNREAKHFSRLLELAPAATA